MSGNITLSSLGSGIPGSQAKLVGDMIGSSERGQSRFILRQAFGRKKWLEQVIGHSVQPKVGNFRYAMNAGDILGTVNESPLSSLPHPNQNNGQLYARNYDGIHTGNAAYSGNPKYVYDSSDYIRFKKLQAKLRTYNN